MDSRSSEFWYLLSSRSSITSCKTAFSFPFESHAVVWEACGRPSLLPYLDDVGKVFPFNVVVRLDEDLPQDGLSDGVVFGVELVEAVERVSVLRGGIKPN